MNTIVKGCGLRTGLLVVFVAMAVSSTATDWESTGNTHWVNNQTGSDDTGDGSEAKPYATINKAVSIMAKDDIVKIVPGKPYVLTEVITNASAFTADPYYAHLTITSSTDERVIIDGDGKCRGMHIGGRGLYFRNLCFTNCVGSATGNGVALSFANPGSGWGADAEMWRLGVRIQNCGFYCCTNTYDDTNTKGVSPAAFYAHKMFVEDCDFAYCYGGFAGGAVFSPNLCYERFTNCTFYGNTANKYAGAIMSDSYSGNIQLIDCTFTSNSVRSRVCDGYSTGGALRGTFANINRCIFTGNYAYGGGGAFYSRSGRSYIYNSKFIGNSSQGDNWYPGGGAVYFWDGGTITNCWFESNSIAAACGGAVFHKGGLIKMCDCTFTNNSAASGGAYFEGGVGSAATGSVDRLRFLYNKASSYGGAYYSQPNALNYNDLRNCLFVGNQAQYGGAVMMTHWSTMLAGRCESCTFVDNKASSYGGAIYMDWSTYVVTNCLFSGNLKGSTVQDTYAGSHGSIGLDHCFLSTDGDPKFVNAAAGDYKLRSSSPCRNQGVNHAWMLNNTDLLNRPRKGRINEEIVDIGCYEYWPHLGTVIIFR